MIDGEKLIEDLREMDVKLMGYAEEAEFEGYKSRADKFTAQRKYLHYSIWLINSGDYDIKEPIK